MYIKACNTIKVSNFHSGIGSRANLRQYEEGNTDEGSIFRSGIDSRQIYVSINILGLVKLVGWDTH